MPSIDTRTVQRLIRSQRRYADSLARQLAEIRLDEVEAHVHDERQRRGLQPVTTDTGTIIAWVHTRQQTPGGR
jgi:hypothetical protein